MDNIAIFSDIHGNIEALQTVIEDIENKGIKDIYCLGDLVGYSVFPNEVIKLIREKNITTVMGNYDQGVGNNSDDCGCAYKTEESKILGKKSILWTNKTVTDENKKFLRNLHDKIEITTGKFRCRLVHGSPRKINEYLFEDRPESSLQHIFDKINADVIICGHTHMPYHKILSTGKHVINDGSCGKPHDGDPRACYIILDGSTNTLKVEFIRVKYDVEKTAKAIEESGMPSEFAKIIRTGNK